MGKEYKAGQGLNENVERVRRAHQNDIENILPFLILGFLYMFLTPPTPPPSSATESLLVPGSSTPLSTSSSSPSLAELSPSSLASLSTSTWLSRSSQHLCEESQIKRLVSH